MRSLLALVLLMFPSHHQADPVEQLGWLVGGVWTASGPQLGPHMQRIETRYQWADNHSYIRFTTHFVTDSADVHRYDGNMFWDAAQSTLSMWYMDAAHEITQGPMTVDGNRWDMTFREYRVNIVRQSNDLYHWSLKQNVGGSWKELLALDYTRR
jgi:hypothetical protein